MKYKNPVIKGFHPDPSFCRKDEDYYLVNSTFEWLPGLPVFHSRDLIHWEQIGNALNRKEQMEFSGCWSNGGIFAPTIRYHNGLFYIVTTNVSHDGAMAPGGSGNFIITAENPAGEWSLPVWIAQGGIDPSLFFDEDGKVYFTSTMHGTDEYGRPQNQITQAEIDPATGELLSESRVISHGNGGRFAEGPHLYKVRGMYYLMTAEGGTEFGHMESIARSWSPWGPFESCPDNPILTASQSYDPTLCGTGHADLLEAHDGSWWLAFLCYRVSENYYHHMGRETAVAPVCWENGWPVINMGITPEEDMAAECLPAADFAGNAVRTSFSSLQKLGLSWLTLRTYFEGYSFEENPGFLTLRGNEKTLNDRATPAFLGIRLTDFESRIETCLSFKPVHENEEAGIAFAHNTDGHTEFVITRRNGKKTVLLRRKVFDLVTEEAFGELPEGPVRLKAETDRYDIRFSFGIEKDGMVSYTDAGSEKVKLLSSEIVGGCIAVICGMYASGNGKECTVPAKYSWFDYEILPAKPKRAMFFDDGE